jgi:hypothetical protein
MRGCDATSRAATAPEVPEAPTTPTRSGAI